MEIRAQVETYKNNLDIGGQAQMQQLNKVSYETEAQGEAHAA